MSPLRGRKIRRIYINSEDNYNENSLSKINNGNYDDNYNRYNHYRKLSKLSGINLSEIGQVGGVGTGSGMCIEKASSNLGNLENNIADFNGVNLGESTHNNKQVVNAIIGDYRINQGINIENICKDDASMLNNSQENMYIKNLNPIQLKYLQKTQKMLSYELSNYKSGIKQLLSIPEYLPCDM
ncbi:uncharacterized protein cubi_01639 [Cryptosporidium ubiquitum]|uniref:Uncharacterized protein n=1 Tax=Cryptosporidium ubiquitum TaxID=857276 RepID=A0A1J4MEQ7_9CRYT|nr:uncharacterized protein cubi_01639 [Cryptosporidium ubiquitum]OII72689.1 hypothetical protein cubi_01639 [Cryptosporidium ubiquitum]